jgi:hydrogenase-4 component E
VAPYLGTSTTLGICAVLVVIAVYVMAPVTASNRLPTADGIPLAFAGVLIGLFTTVNRRRALTQILGFLMLENSIFMIALLATYGVPLIVEMGVFLDMLVAVLILEVFVYRIKENLDSIDVKQLGVLRG